MDRTGSGPCLMAG